jgi:hypothetical protein
MESGNVAPTGLFHFRASTINMPLLAELAPSQFRNFKYFLAKTGQGGKKQSL